MAQFGLSEVVRRVECWVNTLWVESASLDQGQHSRMSVYWPIGDQMLFQGPFLWWIGAAILLGVGAIFIDQAGSGACSLM